MSRKIVNNSLPYDSRTVTTVNDIQNWGGSVGTKIYDKTKMTEYIFVDDASYAIDNTTVCPTAFGGNTRWVGISGKFNKFVGESRPMFIDVYASDFVGYSYTINEMYGQTFIVHDLPEAAFSIGCNLAYLPQNKGKYCYVITSDIGDDLQILDAGSAEKYSSYKIAVLDNAYSVVYAQTANYGQYMKGLRLSSPLAGSSIPTGSLDALNILGSVSVLANNCTSSKNIDYSDFMVCCNSFSPITITLPISPPPGRTYIIKKYNGASPVTVVRGNTSWSIEGRASVTLYNLYDYVILTAFQGNKWLISGTNVPELNPYLNIIATTNLSLEYRTDNVACNNTSDITITLPARSTVHLGKEITIKRINTGSVSIVPAGSDTIEGMTVINLLQQYDGVTLKNNGVSWEITTTSKLTLAGTGAPPSPTGLIDGTIYIQYT